MAEATIPSVAARANLAPLVSWQGAALAVVLGLVLAWPMLTGAYYFFHDTHVYLRRGDGFWNTFFDIFGLFAGTGSADTAAVGGDAAVPAEPAGGGDDDLPVKGRSLVYSPFAYALVASIGPSALAVAQGAITLFAVFGLIGPEALARPGRLAAGFAGLVLLSSLPIYAVFLIPDLLAAVPIIFAAILACRFDDLGVGQKIALTAVTAFAIGCHYGNIPLGLAVIGAAFLYRMVVGRAGRTAIVAVALALVAAPVYNFIATSVALDEGRITPMRVPVLLMRSIEDGPARWYLEDVCPGADLVSCEVLADDMPESIPAFDEIYRNLPASLAHQVRDEEVAIITAAFLRYPLAQTRSLLDNAALQLVRIGTGDIRSASGLRPDFRPLQDPPPPPASEWLIDIYDEILPWTSLAAAAGLAGLLAAGRLDRTQTEILAFVVLGLLANAAIFGGLSAPVERYQTRIIWLLPFLLVLFWAEGTGRGRKAVP